MMKGYQVRGKQLKLLQVKEEESKHTPAKRVNVISLKMIKESSMLYKYRVIRSPDDSYELLRDFLGEFHRDLSRHEKSTNYHQHMSRRKFKRFVKRFNCTSKGSHESSNSIQFRFDHCRTQSSFRKSRAKSGRYPYHKKINRSR